MPDPDMLTEIDARMLAEAFPAATASTAAIASAAIAELLCPSQWTERLSFLVSSQTILIPSRLRFASDRLSLPPADPAWLMARALQTRSSDGFERQRAVRDLMKGVQPWAAPYVVALIGDYVVEILDDIEAMLTADAEMVLAHFLIANPSFWETIKRRVASYWNAYYRHSYASEHRRAYAKTDYAGFTLIKRLERAILQSKRAET